MVLAYILGAMTLFAIIWKIYDEYQNAKIRKESERLREKNKKDTEYLLKNNIDAALKHFSSDVRLAAIRKTDNQDKLLEVATYDDYSAVRFAALNKLENANAVKAIIAITQNAHWSGKKLPYEHWEPYLKFIKNRTWAKEDLKQMLDNVKNPDIFGLCNIMYKRYDEGLVCQNGYHVGPIDRRTSRSSDNIRESYCRWCNETLNSEYRPADNY